MLSHGREIMFHGGYKGDRLRVNLRLVVNRLKLLEKKKTELAQKARKDIADYLAGGKHERARIRVEHIIREDYLVEAMEILELFCDLLLARFGLIQSMKELDPGLEESISSLIWAAPRLQSEVLELKVVSDQLCSKYSKEYGKLCRSNQNGTVNERLIAKLSVEAPPKILVERYLIEIAKNYNVPFEPDSFVMSEIPPVPEADLIGIYDSNKWGGGGGGGGGGSSGGGGGSAAPFQPSIDTMPTMPTFPSVPPVHMPMPPGMHIGQEVGPSAAYPPPLPQNMNMPYPDNNPAALFLMPPPPPYPGPTSSIPQPLPRTVVPKKQPPENQLDFPELPSVPDSLPTSAIGSNRATADDDVVDFDDLTRRFEELKKKK